MATGASTADAAVVLIDARKGVLVQSRRHAYIASLLRVRHVLVAVNKMDLIGYDEGRSAPSSGFQRGSRSDRGDTGNPVEAIFVPVSALAGDNIVHRSQRCRGTRGHRCWSCWSRCLRRGHARFAPFRFPVQRVLRPDHTFRGFAGQIASGTIRPGRQITVLPSGRSAQVSAS
jgi:sulfate adenylyltransferase subunit 1